MTANEYQQLAMRTAAPLEDPAERLLNAALGLTGESGEFCDVVKKIRYNGHAFPNAENNSRTALKKELGDVAWYLAYAADALGFTLEEILEGNIKKLKARYPDGRFDLRGGLHTGEEE